MLKEWKVVLEVIKMIFFDGVVKEYLKGLLIEDIVVFISLGLKKKVLVGKVNGELLDLCMLIEEDGSFEIIM